MIEDEVEAVVNNFISDDNEEEWQLDDLAQALRGIFPFPAEFDLDSRIKEWRKRNADEIIDEVTELALGAYEAKEAQLGDEVIRRAERQIMLWAVDNRWVRHLTDLDHLREGIGLQAYAQVDPVVAYKRQAFGMYSELMEDIRSDIVKAVFTIQVQQPQQQAPAKLAPTPIARNIRTNRDGANGKQQTVRNTGPQLGRNDPCWCGSGKKYKNCHMKSDQAQSAPGGRPGQKVAAR
jgi:preprotein translocase subunit SecA